MAHSASRITGSGSLAMPFAILLASSLVMRFAAARLPGSSRNRRKPRESYWRRGRCKRSRDTPRRSGKRRSGMRAVMRQRRHWRILHADPTRVAKHHVIMPPSCSSCLAFQMERQSNGAGRSCRSTQSHQRRPQQPTHSQFSGFFHTKIPIATTAARRSEQAASRRCARRGMESNKETTFTNLGAPGRLESQSATSPRR